MNCQKFAEVVSDIAREQILDASVRSEALAHGHGCEPCAMSLEEELAISHRLRTFARSFESIGAPARVEAHVLTAFEQLTLKEPPTAMMSRRRYWISAISAIAALVLILFALSIVRTWHIGRPEGMDAGLKAKAAVPPDQISVSPDGPATGQDIGNQVSLPSQRNSMVRPSRHNAKPTTKQSKPIDNIEIATDFLPLTYGGTASLADGGSMVRVELPRSAMASFGLPVNMDRANERVKADVLLGVDGLAHAIRFVAISNVK